MLEVVISTAIIGGMLLTLLAASTASFSFQGMARQRETANAVANQVMERVRALPKEDITSGLYLGGNSRLDRLQPLYAKSCKKVYRLLSCTGSAGVGSGEEIVFCQPTQQAPNCHEGNKPISSTAAEFTSSGPGNTGTVTADGIRYTWFAYVTKRSATQPLRLNVFVSWTWRGRANSVQVQSLASFPSGCVSDVVHLVGAPCGSGAGAETVGGVAQIDVAWCPKATAIASCNYGSAPYNFSMSLGTATISYLEEQTKLASASVTLPDTQQVGITSDNDPMTSTVEASSMYTVQMPTTSGVLKSVPGETTSFLEARWNSTSGTAGPYGKVQSAVAAAAGVTNPCTSIGVNGAPCLGASLSQTGGGTGNAGGAIQLHFYDPANGYFPLLRFESDPAGGGVAAPWSLLLTLDSTTAVPPVMTMSAIRKFSKISFGAYNCNPSTAAAGCSSAATPAAPTALGTGYDYLGMLTGVCDQAKLQLPSTAVTSSGCGGTARTSVLKTGTTSGTSPCGAAPTYTTSTNPISSVPVASAWACLLTTTANTYRAWKITSVTYTPSTASVQGSLRYDYQAVQCLKTTGGNAVKCDAIAQYTTALTPNFRVTITFGKVSPTQTSYEGW